MLHLPRSLRSIFVTAELLVPQEPVPTWLVEQGLVRAQLVIGCAEATGVEDAIALEYRGPKKW